jgi:hypothetical protein
MNDATLCTVPAGLNQRNRTQWRPTPLCVNHTGDEKPPNDLIGLFWTRWRRKPFLVEVSKCFKLVAKTTVPTKHPAGWGRYWTVCVEVCWYSWIWGTCDEKPSTALCWSWCRTMSRVSNLSRGRRLVKLNNGEAMCHINRDERRLANAGQ